MVDEKSDVDMPEAAAAFAAVWHNALDMRGLRSVVLLIEVAGVMVRMVEISLLMAVPWRFCLCR